jgi:hypothetical protein
MNQIHIEKSMIIDASPADVYAILSDYRTNHPAILPRAFFSKLAVLQGGQGAGTVIEVHMDIYGAKRVYHQVVSEPKPGRVLVETDAGAGVVTTFTIDPVGVGNQSRVTIATDSRLSPGVQGLIEKLVNPIITRRIYQQELDLLANYLRHGL